MAEEVVVGIDVSKAKLDVAILPSGEEFSVSNDLAGVTRLKQRLLELAPKRVVLEATGKLERLAVTELGGAGLPVIVVNPRRVRHYAEALGQRAKTDAIDKRVIVAFARDMKDLEVHPLPDAQTQALAALCRRRRQLMQMLEAENSRLERAEAVIQRSIKGLIRSLQRELERVEKKLDQSIRKSPQRQATRELVQTMTGIGEVNGCTVVAWLPELGRCSRQRITALVGIAPYPDQSGESDRRRHIAGGRAELRQSLYMAALSAVRFNPTLRDYYQRLLARGVAKKAATIAALRKMLTILNAMVRDNTPWRPPCPSAG